MEVQPWIYQHPHLSAAAAAAAVAVEEEGGVAPVGAGRRTKHENSKRQ